MLRRQLECLGPGILKLGDHVSMQLFSVPTKTISSRMGNKSGKSKSSGAKTNILVDENEFTPEEKVKYMEIYNISETTYKEIKNDWQRYSTGGKMSRYAFTSHMKPSLMHLDDEFLGRVFDCFDVDKSGNMDFEEYFECRGIILGGPVEQKLEASFRLFDKDGNGELDRAEIIKILELATFSLVRKVLILKLGADAAMRIPLELDDEAIQETKTMATKIFAVADKDNSGTINFEEFKEGFAKDPSIMGFFKQF